jgi:hypothetical protein
MAYTTYQEIQADFKDVTFTTTTNVKSAEVTQFIVESDALIDAYVGTVYTVPVETGDSALALLKLLSRSLVTARIKKIMEVKQDKSTDANQSVVGVLLSPAQVMNILKDLQKKIIKLDGAVVLSASGGFNSFNVTNSTEAVMKKDSSQW